MKLTLMGILALVLYAADVFLFVPIYTKKKYDHSSRTDKLIWKGICIGIPLAVLLAGFIYESTAGEFTAVRLMVLLGMLACAAGDIVLEIRFVRGGFLFFTGHLLYVIALILYTKEISGTAIVVYLMLAGIGTFLTVDKLDKKYRTLLIGYNLMISASFALGVELFLTYETVNMLWGLGSMFLVISDWLLARTKMAGSIFRRSLIYLEFYFVGQMLISAIVLF